MDIYDYIHEFLGKLDKVENLATTKKFRMLLKNCDRIKLVGEVFDKYNVLSDYKIFDEKSNEKSAELRKQGNTYFSLKNKNYTLALEYYNQSICYAELNTECLATGYANRSAIYYEWKLYHKCLQNIELAFQACSSISEKLSGKLESRKKACLDSIGNKAEKFLEYEPIDLSYPAHSRIPFIVECLEMEQNEQFGRFIKTTQDLYPGDCIIIEKPSAVIVVPEQIYKRCAQCLVENNYSLIPCEHCTARMYCCSECRNVAYTSYHRFECSAINGLTKLFNKIHLTALNVVLKLFSNMSYIDQTIDYLNDFKTTDSYNFDYKSTYDYATEYKMLHSLVTNESIRSVSDLFQRAGIAAILYKFLKTNKYLQEIFAKSTVDRKYDDLFLTLIFHHLQTAPSNFHSIDMIDIQIEGADLTYGSGAYPFSSLINHSCAPNIIRYGRDQTVENIFLVIRKITKGQQLFDNYGSHHCLQPKYERQKKLEQYNFKCVCEACTLDWPLYHELEIHPKLPLIITEKVKMELIEYNRPYAKRLKPIIIDFLRKYDKYYPTAQICDAQEGFKMCMFILLKEIPMQGSNKN